MSSKPSKKAEKRALLAEDAHSDNYQSDFSDISNGFGVEDKHNLIYFIAMLLGCGILLAYNFLVSAPDYFEDEYPNNSNINMLIVPAYTIPDVIFLILAVFYGHLFSFTSRICICFLTMGIVMFFPIFTQYIFGSENTGFYIIMGVAAWTGVTTAILQSAVIGFCNYLPISYIQVSISGQSVAGIAAGVIRIIINLIEQSGVISAKTNGMIYFGIGGLFDLLCGVLFLYTIRNAFVKFHLQQYFWTRKYRGNEQSIPKDLLERTDTQNILRKQLGNENIPTPKAADFEALSQQTFTQKNTVTVITESQSRKVKTKVKRKRTPKERKLAKSMERQNNSYMKFRSDSDSSDQSQSNMTTDNEQDFEDGNIEITKSGTHSVNNSGYLGGSKSNKFGIGAFTEDIISVETQNATVKNENEIETEIEMDSEPELDSEKDDKVTYCGVFGKIKWLVLALFLVFFVTFVPFPGMLTGLDSEYKWVNDGNWMPVFLVLEFNICDYIGRQFFAAWTTCSFSKRTLWIACLWRIVIIPFIIALYVGLIKIDIVAYISTMMLGITNGHFCCLCFMWAPSLVNSNEQQLCGAIMSFALVMGITLGSYTTLLLHTIGLIVS